MNTVNDHNILSRPHVIWIIVAAVTMVILFVINLYAPMSVAIGSVYCVVILYSWFLPWKHLEIYVASVCSVLAITAFVFTEEAPQTLLSGINVLMGLIAFWVSTSLVTIAKRGYRALDYEKLFHEQQLKIHTLELNEKRSTHDFRQSIMEKGNSRFQALLESAPDSMVIVTDQGKIQFINAQAETIFGYSREELIGRGINLLFPDGFSDFRSVISTEYGGHTNLNNRSVMEYEGLRKNGQVFPTELSLCPLITEEDILYSLAIRNISERKEAETNYHRISERLSIATNAGKIGIWEYNFESKSIYWDAITYQHFGLVEGQGDDLDTYCKSVVHPEDLFHVFREMKLAIKEARDARFEVRLILPDQPIRFLMITGIFERNGTNRAVRMTGTCLDITELKIAQMGLQRREESFMGAFANSAIGMALVDLNGQFMKVNNSMCESLGYTSAELIGLTFQEITYPDDLNKDLKLLDETLRNQRDSYQIDKRYFHKNGNVVAVILTVTAVKDIYGELSHFISQIIDITPRIEADKKMVLLVEVTKGQNESLMNFAHIVSHNLRSHTTNLSMLTNFLQKEEDVAEREHITNMLLNASESLSETVQHLNDVVQVKFNILEEQKSVNLLLTMNMVERNINAFLNENKVEYRMDIPESHHVSVVPAYLDSILLNLYTNAIKYKSPYRDLILDICSQESNEEIILKFRDNGQGIDLNRHRGSIFGMYKTFHKQEHAKGIGLYITKNQIEAMQGSIDVISEVNVGSTFILKFKNSNHPNNIIHEPKDSHQLYHR